MGKLVILQLPEGDFQRGFSCTVQIGLDGGTIEKFAQITGRLPANPDMPQKLNDEWRSVFNFNENSRIKAKQAGVTNFSQTDAVNNFIEHFNNWLNNSTYSEWQKIRDFLQQSLNNEEEIRVIIQTQDPILRRIPWQAWNLFAENYPSSEIALSPTTFATPGDLPPSNSNKVRILVVLGSSTVADGSQEIDITFDQQELEKLKQLGAFLKFLKQPDPQELRDCLWLEEGWDIFFFAGHSSSSLDGQDGEIILNARAQGFKITELCEALKKAISRGLQLAIFNSCDGLGLANQLAELNIRQMIVMREPVPDAVAKTFLKHFLTALACNNQSLYASVREARLRLEDWNEQYPGAKYLPVICQNPAVIPPTWEKLRTGGRIHGANWDINSHLSHENVNPRRIGASIWNFFFGQQAVATVGNPARPENQRILLAAVKEEVTARLRQSLHNTVLINLGKESQPQQVKRPWDAEIKIGLKPAEPLPDTTTILQVFEREEIVGKLLILGAPGSGKTTTQLELAQELIKRAEEQPNYPVPVLFNLSSWKDDRLSLVDWLLAELESKYGVSKKLGKEWVNKRQLLPLLDGLDELEPQRQELCVLAINQFLAGDIRPFYLVVCSRIEEYSNYATQLQLNGAIYLQPLTNNQICAYLSSIEYIELWSTISSDIDLLELVKTPLLLSITVLASKEISVEEWQRLTSTANRLQYLLDAYVGRMLRRDINSRAYLKNKTPNARKTRMHLVWLAKQMQNESKTEFLIEGMQPSLLKTKIAKVIYNLMVWGVIPGLIYGLYGLIEVLIVVLIFGLINGLFGEIIEYKLEKIILIRNHNYSHKIIVKWLIIGLSNGLIIGLIYGLTEGLINGLVNGPIFGLINGLIFGLIGDEVKTFETLKFSYNNFKKVLIYGMIIGMIIGLIYGLIGALINGMKYGLIDVLIDVLKYGLIYGPIGGLLFGFSSLEIENKNIPNQGIWQSAKNIPKLLVFYLVPSTILIFLIQRILQNNFLPNDNSLSGALIVSLISGFFFGLLGGMLRGGTPVIKHFTLRLILYFSGYIPWNYARFLDYCTERLFLQRVGGRYRFIHKLLQDHFAQMEFKQD